MSEDKDILALNHDVNNQLGVAMGNFEMMLMKNPSLQDSEHAKRIENGLARARDLSHELAQTYRDTGKTELTNKDFTLISVQNHLVKSAPEAYEKLMQIYDINIELHVNMIEAPKQAYLNPHELIRLRENIVSNSLAAGATTLDVNIEMKPTYLVATFSDNGKGMTQEELDKTILFQHGDGKTHGVGTRSIIEGASKHGYSISYSSILGTGTTIRTLVPYYVG